MTLGSNKEILARVIGIQKATHFSENAFKHRTMSGIFFPDLSSIGDSIISQNAWLLPIFFLDSNLLRSAFLA